MDDEMIDDGLGDDDVDLPEDDLEGDFEEEFADDDIPDVIGDDIADDDEVAVEVDEDLEDPPVPARRARDKDKDEEDDEDEDELDPDDIEEDLDTILKDRIAAGDDLDDDEEEEVEDTSSSELAEGVTAKRDGEFSCAGCFMIVHPRQFGRLDNLTCPKGDEDCPSIEVVRELRTHG
jgi:hypothetical protein